MILHAAVCDLRQRQSKFVNQRLHRSAAACVEQDTVRRRWIIRPRQFDVDRVSKETAEQGFGTNAVSGNQNNAVELRYRRSKSADSNRPIAALDAARKVIIEFILDRVADGQIY